ncbi:apyrase 2-like [Momordica charantia]|uniref:Apyrase 2-like n=1 Tax=Momordica charantia TaxID=3673 RepID=A0A6J1DJU1_MOMCH|nr:apyrase 2-like [Momordica charantia]
MAETGARRRHELSTLLLLSLLLILPVSSAGENLSFNFNHRKISTIVGSSSSVSNSTYAVIFDAGSSGSRVHVFHFDQNLNLLFIGSDIEVFSQIKPGLSSYADDPQKAADSLIPLLEKAESAVPQKLQSVTPVRLGATAGLRFLEGDRSEKILEAVRVLLKSKSGFKYDADSVSILDGNQEGSYQWLTINYLLEKLGTKYSNTVGVIDLGGGSVQMAYAISDQDAANAPISSDGSSKFVQNLYLKGAKYNLYVHSYLRYGLQAVRVEILKVTKELGNPCILAGYEGTYTYGGEEYKASAPRSGSSFARCRRVILEALKINQYCGYSECTFDGIWSGGGGVGQKNIYVASFFFDKAGQAGFIDANQPDAVVKAIDFKRAAMVACETKFVDAKSKYPNVYPSDLQFVCMDLVYEYTLLVDGFGIDSRKKITLVKQVAYHGSLAEAAWPLGNAVAVVSSPKGSTANY